MAKKPTPDAQETRANLLFLLAEVRHWSERGWLTEEAAREIESQYGARLQALLRSEEAGSAAQTHGPAGPANGPRGSAAVTAVRTEDRSASLSSVLETHSVKLFALLAALFIFVGMRQILGGSSGAGILQELVPLLPLVLSAGFFYAGTHAGASGTLGRYVYCNIAIGLAAATVYSAQTRWLGGALSGSFTLLLSAAAATALSAWILRATRDRAFLHPLLLGAGVVLFGTVEAALSHHRPLMSLSWIHGIAFAALGLALLAQARRPRPAAEGAIFRTWGYGYLAAVSAAAVQTAVSGRSLDAGIFSLAAGAALLISSFWLSDTIPAYAAGALFAAGALALLQQAGWSRWHGPAIAALLACVGVLLLRESIRRRWPEEPPTVAGYSIISWAFGVCAGALLFLRALASLIHAAPPAASDDWVAGVVLSAGFFALCLTASRKADRQRLLYPAVGALAFGTTTAASRLIPTITLLLPRTTAQDLLPFVTAAALLAWHARRGIERTVFLRGACAGAWLGLAAAGAAALVQGSAPGVWASLLAYLALFILATVRLRKSVHGPAWAWGFSVNLGLVAGFAAQHATFLQGPRPIVAGSIVSIVAWALFGLTRSGVGALSIARALRGGAVLLALAAAALATISADAAPGMMAGIYASALALMTAMGALQGSQTPIYASFALALLCPARFAPAALGEGEAGITAVLAAVLFAEAAAAIYLLAAWRMSQPGLAWLAVMAVAVAGGGGLLFGGSTSASALLISTVSGAGLLLGGAVTGVFALKRESRGLPYIVPLFIVGGYLRLATACFSPGPLWTALALLPAFAILLVAAEVRSERFGRRLTVPIRRTAVAGAGIAITFISAYAFARGAAARDAAAVTLLCYALIFAAAAQARERVDHAAGVVSTAALIGGWLYGFQTPGGRLPDLALVVTSGLCAILYGRMAWRWKTPAPGYGAAVAFACGWMALVGRVVDAPAALWGMLALLPLVGMYGAGVKLGRIKAEALSIPLKRSAIGLALPAMVSTLSIAWGSGGRAYVPASVTLVLYGAAFLAAFSLQRSAGLLAAACASLELAALVLLTSAAQSLADAAVGAALTANLWVVAARVAQARVADKPAGVLYAAASISGIGAALLALIALTNPAGAIRGFAALGIAEIAQIAAYLLTRDGRQAHVAALSFLSAHTAAWILFASRSAFMADFIVAPWAAYLVALGHLMARRSPSCLASALNGIGIMGALITAFVGFHLSNAPGGSPIHALLLLAECILAIAWGTAIRSRFSVYVGVGFAFTFAAVGTVAAAQLWTGVFAVLTGVALLATVFYASSHQDVVARWASQLGARHRLPH